MILKLTILAFLIALGTFPIALRYARKHQIVDNPNARKLQKTPVPVLGGSVVVIGMLIPLMMVASFGHITDLWYIIGAILVLWTIGTIDDVRGLPAWMRFALETILIWLFVWHPNTPDTGLMINSLHGIWGREMLSPFSAIPLTLLAGVGIINSINLIDGVDGYSSGYGMAASTLFGSLFLYVGDTGMAIFSFVAAAALLPFFLHNVFGKTSKMFIGDGGSLVIGLVLTYDTFAVLCEPSVADPLKADGVSLVALSLAILCIPVFDTLRVMFARILRGEGPFSPDKTHLHHLYIEMGFSHVGTSMTIIMTNLMVVLLWWVGYRLGLSITGQFYLVVVLGLLTIPCFYYGMKAAQRRKNALWQLARRVGVWTHFERRCIWTTMQRLIDRLA